MDLRQKLASRISMLDINEITLSVQHNETRMESLYKLLFDPDTKISYQAAWVMTHLSLEENKWLYSKQNEIVDKLMTCQHAGKTRLMLQLLYKQAIIAPPRTDFLNFCLDLINSPKAEIAIRALAIKLAYRMCKDSNELLNEFLALIELMDINQSPAAIRTTRNNILRRIKTQKALELD